MTQKPPAATLVFSLRRLFSIIISPETALKITFHGPFCGHFPLFCRMVPIFPDEKQEYASPV